MSSIQQRPNASRAPRNDPFDITTLRPGERIRFTSVEEDGVSLGTTATALRYADPMPGRAMPDAPTHVPRSPRIPTPPPQIRHADAQMNAVLTQMFGPGAEQLSEVLAPAVRYACIRYNLSLAQLSFTLEALSRYPKTAIMPTACTPELRQKALCVAIVVAGADGGKTPEEVVAEGRTVTWTRLTRFVGDGALSLLFGTMVEGTLATATYMVGAYAASQVASAKAATVAGAKFKGAALATGAVVGAAALGGATVLGGALTIGYWYEVINAYRDCWDNEQARDAYVLHRLREHGALPGQAATSCRHRDGTFTSPNALLHAYLTGKRNN